MLNIEVVVVDYINHHVCENNGGPPYYCDKYIDIYWNKKLCPVKTVVDKYAILDGQCLHFLCYQQPELITKLQHVIEYLNFMKP